jgi:hypothetical protein
MPTWQQPQTPLQSNMATATNTAKAAARTHLHVQNDAIIRPRRGVQRGLQGGVGAGVPQSHARPADAERPYRHTTHTVHMHAYTQRHATLSRRCGGAGELCVAQSSASNQCRTCRTCTCCSTTNPHPTPHPHLCGCNGLMAGTCASASVPHSSSLPMASAGLTTAHTRQPHDVSASISTCLTCRAPVAWVGKLARGWGRGRHEQSGGKASRRMPCTQSHHNTLLFTAQSEFERQISDGVAAHHLARLHEKNLLAAQQRQ